VAAPARRHGKGAGARSRAVPVRTSRSLISTLNCGSKCAPDQKAFISGSGKTTIYVTHDQVEAMTLASRIAVMHHGCAAFCRAANGLYRPAKHFVASFMGSPPMNFLPAQIAVSGPAAVLLKENDGQATRLPFPKSRPVWWQRPSRRAGDKAGKLDSLRLPARRRKRPISARIEPWSSIEQRCRAMVVAHRAARFRSLEPNGRPPIGEPVSFLLIWPRRVCSIRRQKC